MKVRWLGAFRKTGDLADSLEYELSGRDASLRAAEDLRTRTVGEIQHATVGLLVKNRAVVRRYAGDVWSEKDGRRLRITRSETQAGSDHRECWIRPDYAAIVIKSKGCGSRSISKNALLAIKAAARKYQLPILRLTADGKTEEVKINA